MEPQSKRGYLVMIIIGSLLFFLCQPLTYSRILFLLFKFMCTGHWLYGVIHIFFSKRILCDFCIEAFPKCLHCRNVGTAMCVAGGSWDLTWGVHLQSKLMEVTFITFLFGLVWKLVIKIWGRLEYSQASPCLPRQTATSKGM